MVNNLSNIGEMEKRILQIKNILDSKKHQDEESVNLTNELSDLQQNRSLLIGETYGTLSHSKIIKDELLSKLDTVQQNIDSIIDAKLAEVSHWEYATDEYFSPYPYHAEIHNFKRGRILKNARHDERFNKRTTHSFGFNESEQLIIMQFPNADNDIRFGVGTKIYFPNADKGIDGFVANWYPENRKLTKLESINVFKPLADNSWIYVVVNSNKANWSANHYIYNELNCIEHVVSCSLYAGKPLCEFLNFIYDKEGQLEKIMVGDYTQWKRNTK